MRYARIENGRVVEIIEPAFDDEQNEIDIEERFASGIVATLEEEGPGMVLNGTWDGINYGPQFTPAELFNSAKNNKIEAINSLRDVKKSLPILSEGYQIDTGDLQVGEMATTMFLGRGVSTDLTSLTSSGDVASASTQKKHNLVSGQTISVIGADQPQYNTTDIITVTGNKTFDYPITGSPASPATGGISFTVGSFQHIPTTNETDAMIDGDTYSQIAYDLKGYLDACQMRARVLKNQVLAAADIAEIDAIDINVGWPDTGI